MTGAPAEALSAGLLVAALAFAVVRPKGWPEAIAAVPAAVVVVAAGAVSPHDASAELRRLLPVVGFLAAILVLARCANRIVRHGRVEREVVRAAQDAELLVLARDGDRTRLRRRSLGPQTRFVVNHAPCPVLLVWPEAAADVTSLPPPPPHKMH